MDQTFVQWKEARQLNEIIGIDACQWVVLLPYTQHFNVEKDLKKTLGITKQPLVWFVQQFKKYKVRVEYATVFTDKELETFGPVGISTSQGMVAVLLQKFYPPETIVVCPKRYTVKRYKCISSDTFVHQTLRSSPHRDQSGQSNVGLL